MINKRTIREKERKKEQRHRNEFCGFLPFALRVETGLGCLFPFARLLSPTSQTLTLNIVSAYFFMGPVIIIMETLKRSYVILISSVAPTCGSYTVHPSWLHAFNLIRSFSFYGSLLFFFCLSFFLSFFLLIINFSIKEGPSFCC